MMVMTPYPGYDGEFFSMPCRNIVPKPAQKPHPPLWVAGKPDVAARYGMGCLGFNVVGGKQAKVMVDQYYRTLAEECVPIGHAVNPNIAVLATLHCHRDADTARRNGEHLKFFGYTIGKYYLNGQVRPGAGGAWEEFLAVKDQFPEMGDSPTSAIGTPEQIREHLRALQAAGVDQVLLMHQGGQLDHDANCRSLELFATEVMPEFVEGEAEREAAKAERLAPGHRGRAGPQGAPADARRDPGRRDVRPLQPLPHGRRLRHRGHVGGHARRARGAAMTAQVHDVRDNGEQQRYELSVDGRMIGIADYYRTGDVMVLPHTFIEPRERNQGWGEVLVREALDDIRRQGLRIEPQCWFVAEFVELNPTYADLVA